MDKKAMSLKWNYFSLGASVILIGVFVFNYFLKSLPKYVLGSFAPLWLCAILIVFVLIGLAHILVALGIIKPNSTIKISAIVQGIAASLFIFFSFAAYTILTYNIDTFNRTIMLTLFFLLPIVIGMLVGVVMFIVGIVQSIF